MTAPAPCICWSCDKQCGGNAEPGWCGPVADVDGRPICEFCRGDADVFDTERNGVKVTISQDRVRLNPDVFGYGRNNLWLDAASARHLAAVLTQRADELDEQS